jgi:hypothetical protein
MPVEVAPIWHWRGQRWNLAQFIEDWLDPRNIYSDIIVNEETTIFWLHSQ